jgi:hypothetical protein
MPRINQEIPVNLTKTFVLSSEVPINSIAQLTRNVSQDLVSYYVPSPQEPKVLFDKTFRGNDLYAFPGQISPEIIDDNPEKSTVQSSAAWSFKYSGIKKDHFKSLGSLLDHVMRADVGGTYKYSSFSISAWVKIGDLAHPNIIIYRGTPSVLEFELRYEGQKIWFRIGNGTNSTDYIGVKNALNPITTSDWFHVVITYDNSLNAPIDRFKIYIDSQDQALSSYNNGSAPTVTVDSNGPTCFGCKVGYESTDDLDGRMYAVGIWKRCLTSSEVFAIYHATATGLDLETNSGYVSTPARLKLRELDDHSNSYSTIRRTGDSRKGTLETNFYDDHTVVFSNQRIDFPSMIPASSRFNNQTTRIIGENSDIKSVIPVRSHQVPNFLHFSPEENMGPFDDKKSLPANDFFLSGTDQSIMQGFSSPLRSKTSIEIDITPSSESVFTRNVRARNVIESNPVSPDNTGFKYFNFELQEWQQIGKYSFASNQSIRYDYAYNPSMGYGSGTFPMQFVPSNHDSNFEQSTFGYEKIGSPTMVGAAPLSQSYHATSSQCLRLSNYISDPFLLEAVVVEFDDVNAQRLNGTTSPSNPVDSVIYASGSTRDIDNYMFFIYRQTRKNGDDDDVRAAANSSQRFLVVSGAMTFWNSPSLYGGTLLHSPAFSHDFGLPYTDAFAVGEYTGSIKMNLTPGVASSQFEGYSRIPDNSGGGTQFLTHIWNGGTSNKNFVRKFGFGGISPLLDNTSYQELISTSQNYDARASKAYGLQNNETYEVEDWTGYDIKSSANTSCKSPYLLFPSDELVFGIEAGISPAKSMSNVSHLTGSFLKINTGACKITLIGSLIKNGAELLPSLNQNLSSNSVHEIVGAESVVDQFQIESAGSYYGSYLDEILAGSLVEYSRKNNQYTVFEQGDSGARRVISKASAGNAGTTGSLQRFSIKSDMNERIYDSCLPDYGEYFSNSATLSTDPATKKLSILMNSPFIHESTDLLPDQFPYVNNPTRIKNNSVFDTTLYSDPLNLLHGISLSIDKKIRSAIFRVGWKINKIASSNLLAHRYENYNSSLRSQRPASSGSAYRYGISNVEPQFSRSAWKSDHFGYFRDMLEQRNLTATPGSEPPIKCIFLSGSTHVNPIYTVSQNLSAFATSSLPYFDDGTSHSRNTELLDMLEVV